MCHNFPAWYTVCLSLFPIFCVLYFITTIHKEPMSFHIFPNPQFMSISQFWKRTTSPSYSKPIYDCLRLRADHFLRPAVPHTTRRLCHNAPRSGISLATMKWFLQDHFRDSLRRAINYSGNTISLGTCWVSCDETRIFAGVHWTWWFTDFSCSS